LAKTMTAAKAAIFGVVLVAGGLAGTSAVVPIPVVASAGPFTCEPGFYQVISGQLEELNPATGAYTDIGSAYSTTYNAMGYDVQDDYLYAMGTGSAATDEADLLRIASDGSVTNLGRPTGLPLADYVSGDMDASGRLLVQATATVWYAINVSSVAATPFTVTGAAGTGADAAWIGGYLYFASNATLYAINLSTMVETSATVSGLPASATYGAAWSDRGGDLFFSANGNGSIYQVTGFTGASPTATRVATGVATNNNDGAACKQAVDPFNLPVAVNDSYTVTSDTTLHVDAADGVLANDTGVGLSVASHTTPADGTLTLNANGSFTYVPNPGYHGTDTFTYSVQDKYGRDSATSATVSIDVELPAAPDATNDSYTTPANTTLDVTAADGVLLNDTGTGITVTSNTDPPDGSLTVGPHGALYYVPLRGSSGIEPFGYTITDAFGRTASADVEIDVTPTVVSSGATTPYDTPLLVTAPGVLKDAVGSGLTISAYGQPAHGSVVVGPHGAFLYTPDAGFDGSDPFTFTAQDSSSLTVNGTFTVSVEAPAAPVASSYSFTTPAGTEFSVGPSGGVLSEDSGASTTVTYNSKPSDGSVSMASDGSFSYTPDTGFSGFDSFTYTITDAVGQTAGNTVDMDVTPVGADQTVDLSFETAGSTDVLTGDVGSGLTAGDLLTEPTGDGTWTYLDGSLDFTPAGGFAGDATFTYAFSDSSDQVASGSVTFDVAMPPGPVAGDISVTTDAGQTLHAGTGAMFASSTGYDLQVLHTGNPSAGILTVNGDGSFEYAPGAGFSGDDSFGFTVTDPFGQTSSAEVEITVDPVANDLAYSTPCGSALSVAAGEGLLSADLGTTLSVSAVTADPSLGSLDWNADGSFTYTPAAAACSQANTLDYTLTDLAGTSAIATVTFDVGPPASILDLSYSVTEGGILTVDSGSGLLGWVAGAGTTVVSHTQPSHGTLSAAADGSFTYTPDPGYSGKDTFTYTAENEGGVLGVGTATITVEIKAASNPSTPDTGSVDRPSWTSLLPGLPLVLLGILALLAVRRRRRPKACAC
jgi:hypothetical protein